MTADHPVFIVGASHSGTSWLLAILGAHSNLHPIGFETYMATQSSLTQYVKRFNREAIKANKKRWVEKTPLHVYHMEKLLKNVPNSRILVIIRDGRDVAYSIKQRMGCCKKGIQQWVRANLAALNYEKNDKVHFLTYEDIVQNFKQTISTVLRFLGEEYEESLEDYYKTPKKWYSNTISKPPDRSSQYHTQYRNWQINQPPFDGRGQWKKLSEAEIQHVTTYGYDLLKKFNYIT